MLADVDVEDDVDENISLFEDLEVDEDEPGFATTGANDVALDMDSECNSGMPDESDDESEDDSEGSDDTKFD